MALVFPTVGDQLLQGLTVNKTTPGNLKLHLYTNNYTPVKGSIISNFTECTATGYSAATLTGSSWDTTTTPATASYAAQTFTLTAAATCYGYYVTDNGSTTVLFAEAFPSVFNIPSGGGSVSVTLNWTAN